MAEEEVLQEAAVVAGDAAVAAGEASQAASEAAVAIEEANARADGNAEMARQIADGAMEGERGERIARIEREMESWRQAQAEANQSLSSLREQMAEVNGALATLVLAQPVPASQTLQEAPVVTASPVLPEVDPVEAELPEAVPEVLPASPRRKNRWI